MEISALHVGTAISFGAVSVTFIKGKGTEDKPPFSIEKEGTIFRIVHNVSGNVRYTTENNAIYWSLPSEIEAKIKDAAKKK